jgi:MFS superfamily sulfate permease-like transporter
MFQVLTEAGWSMIAFDHASRTPENYGFVMVMFCSFHIIITLILATLMKGMILSAFMAVSKQYEVNKQEQGVEDEQMGKNMKKHKQLDDLEILISKLDSLKLDTVVKR